MLNKENNTSYTISVDLLVSAIAGQSNHKPSLYQQAKFYFETADANKAKLQLITDKIAKLKSELPHCSDTKAKLNANRIGKLEWDLDNETSLQQAARLKRLNNAISICMDILSLTEGDDFEETQKKSAKFLTTMALFSPGKGPHLAELHQSLKPAYKAVLSLRMLDKLMLNGMVKNTYMLREYSEAHRYIPESASNICYTQGVIIPIMLAAIFQDVGLQHPELGRLLDGEEGNKDRFRLLDLEERQKMLDLNYQFTIDYLVNGLGCQIADVGSKDEILAFSDAESKRLKFQLALVEGANLNKLGTSEIIKIPQIYASVIFSTKKRFFEKNVNHRIYFNCTTGD
ncbi:hypothetical protein RS130_12400 [Paraglaciecola aquimarina]|uniref:HDOD domain-containing protein n=1 Tax=Paraglaciecola aquimarina TaxID=1235557 RepID=A0ABU3SX71_9ALTE|nr:hypothetical protein [Paraglaciecola aquimarina]MDU0354614.1 hypothetical protein [Paraglaciecola aquimarina]